MAHGGCSEQALDCTRSMSSELIKYTRLRYALEAVLRLAEPRWIAGSGWLEYQVVPYT